MEVKSDGQGLGLVGNQIGTYSKFILESTLYLTGLSWGHVVEIFGFSCLRLSAGPT